MTTEGKNGASHIGVVGGIASGKSTICGVLQRFGFAVISLSDLIVDEARSRGMELATRAQYFQLGDEMRYHRGRDILARLAADEVCRRGWRHFVIEGVRTTGEARFLRSTFPDILLIGVETPLEERLRRVKARSREIDPLDHDLILKNIERENSTNGDGCELLAVMEMTDLRISGELSAAETETSLLSIITR
jgi:dephospho-CoA kinase